MLNQWICVLLQVSSGFSLGFAMDSMQTARKSAPPKWVRMVIWMAAALSGTLYNIFWKDPPTGLNYVSCASTFLAALISICLFYESGLRRQLTITLLLILGVFSAELFATLLLWAFQAPPLSLDYTQPDMVKLSAIGAAASNMVILLTAILWRRFKLHRPTAGGSWTFVLMLLCLGFPAISYMEHLQQTGGNFSPLHILSMTGAMMLHLVLIFLQFHQTEKEEAKKALEELKRTQARQKQHYESMEARREEMAKLRHDYNNHLSSVLGLVRMGNRKEAEAAVKALLQKAEYSPDDRKKERDT